MATQPETFQIPLEAAELYEERFVPSLFAEWAPHLVDAAGVSPGQSVLDVACGTGIVARTAAARTTPGGRVVGVDLNEAMLMVARRVAPSLDWRRGDAADLPCGEGEFDAVLCQMALMFFPNRPAAMREMTRVTMAAGVVAVCVPAALDAQPAYGRFVDMVADRAGPDAASLLHTYWSCGRLDALHALFDAAGLVVTQSDTRTSTASFPSVDAFVATEVESTPLVQRLSTQQYDTIKLDAREVLVEYVKRDGLAVPLVGHIVVGTPRG
ncbi:MAG TPA: methyltransferase domain-containing protein [Nocardioidaceae bacterium]